MVPDSAVTRKGIHPDLEGNKDDGEGTSSQQRTANSLRQGRAFHLKRERE
jgi:hypothetical protein